MHVLLKSFKIETLPIEESLLHYFEHYDFEGVEGLGF